MAKRGGIIGHIRKRELDEKTALLHDKAICHPARLGKLGLNMNSRQFMGMICAKNLCESGISSPLGDPLNYYDALSYPSLVVILQCLKSIYFHGTNIRHTTDKPQYIGPPTS